VRVTVTRLGLVAPPPGASEIALDVRGEWPTAPERLGRADRLCHLSLLAAYRALGEPPASSRPIAVVFGSALASLVTNVRYYDKIQKRGMRLADPKRFPYTAPNAAAGEVAIGFGLIGPNVSLTSGFASGLEAVAVAARFVARGRAPAALAVAADAWSPEVEAVLTRAGVELPAGPREGAAALLLEPEGCPGALLVLESVELGLGSPSPGPIAPAPAPLFALAPEAAAEVRASCPISGARAALRFVAA
jgi:hypothetical protein